MTPKAQPSLFERAQMTKAMAYLRSAHRAIEDATSMSGADAKRAALDHIQQARKKLQGYIDQGKAFH